MNFFCKLLGHTWVQKSEDPKIRWATSKNLSELSQTVSGNVRFYEECARCGDTQGEFVIEATTPQDQLPESAVEEEAAEA